ncbi:MAG: glycosyltransferase family 4 protein [Pseudomonadota bacterium]
MRSIVVTRFRPDRPMGGAALRNWQNINGLARLGPVDVVSVGLPADETRPAPVVRAWRHFPYGTRPFATRMAAKLWRWRPNGHPHIDGYWHPGAAATIRAGGPYDCGVVEELSLARYAGPLRAACKTLVFDAHNVEAELRAAMSASETLIDRRTREAEAAIIGACDLVWACSETDAADIRRRYQPAAPVHAVPNGIRLEDYAPPSGARRAVESGNPVSKPVSLLYAGTYSYPPNEDAALRLIRDVAPALRARGVEAEIVLAGRKPTAAMREAASRAPGVTVTGETPSIVPYFHAADVVMAPIALGSGTRLKLVEAFAARVPVVTTAKGAEGLDAEPGVHALFAETPEETAGAVARLAGDPALRDRLTGAAYALAQAAYSWDVAARLIAESLGVAPADARPDPGAPSAAHAPGAA